jgi:hypothetical protein
MSGDKKIFRIIQLLLLIAAFAVAMVGVVRNTDFNREVIYVGQAVACALFVVFGIFGFKDEKGNFFKLSIFAYALLEALRSVLLNTTGIDSTVATISRFILAVLACNCVLVADRIGEKSGIYAAIGVVVLEVALYIAFLLGFPGVLKGHLNRFMPLVGVLIAGSFVAILLEKSKTSGSGE